MSEQSKLLLMKMLKLLNFLIKMNICMRDANMLHKFMDIGNFIHSSYYLEL